MRVGPARRCSVLTEAVQGAVWFVGLLVRRPGSEASSSGTFGWQVAAPLWASLQCSMKCGVKSFKLHASLNSLVQKIPEGVRLGVQHVCVSVW